MTTISRDFGVRPQDEEKYDRSPGIDFVDVSKPLFRKYMSTAEKEDEKMVLGLMGDADRTLLFSLLFSVVLATLLTGSVRDLRPNPQEKPTFYLENIYQLLADPNRTNFPTFPTQSNPPTFSPPSSAVWVNSLWSLSLVIAISCALLSILVQQWARRYSKVNQRHPNSSPRKRALNHTFFHKGVEELHLQWAVDALPILLHASFVLFLAGLAVFSFRSHHTVFKVVAPWIGLCTVIYAYFTLLPVVLLESPYNTPLSHPLWLYITYSQYLGTRILWWCTAFNYFNEETSDRFGRWKDYYRRRFSQRIEEAAEECAQKSLSEVNSRILLWGLQSIDIDEDLEEQFFASIAFFSNPKVLDEIRAAFKTPYGEKMADALVALMDRILSSNFPQSKKQRRIELCNTIARASPPITRRTLDRVLHGDWDRLLDSVEFGHFLRNARSSGSDPFAKYRSQCMVSVIIAGVKKRDDRWFELATREFGITRSTLGNYLFHGDSTSLANCIHICQRTLETYPNDWPGDVYSQSKTLEIVSSLDVQDTLPELQHEFCKMWNELVRKTGDRSTRNLSIYILKHIRKVYFGLHRGTTAAPIAFSDTTSDDDINLLFSSSYPSCQLAGHHPPDPGSVGLGGFYVGNVGKSEESLPDPDVTLTVTHDDTRLVAPAQQRDESWFELAADEYGIPAADLRHYATLGDSLSLVSLIHTTRQEFRRFRNVSQPWITCQVLEAASKFNVRRTLPKLQHDFCELWNQIIHEVQNENDRLMAYAILGRIRNIYVDLHDTKSPPTTFSASTGDWDQILMDPSSYPLCKVAGHIPDHPTSSAAFGTSLLRSSSASNNSSAGPENIMPMPPPPQSPLLWSVTEEPIEIPLRHAFDDEHMHSGGYDHPPLHKQYDVV